MVLTRQPINIKNNLPGNIFQHNFAFHNQALNKYEKDKDILDIFHQQLPRKLGCSHGQGVSSCPTTSASNHLQEEKARKFLSFEGESWNATIVSSCIIVQNYIGQLTRLCALWNYFF